MKKIKLLVGILAILIIILFLALVREGAKTPALHQAAQKGDLERVKELLAAGEFVDQEDAPGRTALYFAAFFGHTQIIETLLKQGANINHRDCNDWTPLHDAIMGGHKEAIEMLKERGAVK